MKLKINEIDKVAVISFTYKDFFITKSDNTDRGEYMLIHRIDMSYCGKQDQCGDVVMYVSEKNGDRLKAIIEEW